MVRKCCCNDGAGGRGQNRGCQEEGGQQAGGLAVDWPWLWARAGQQLRALCQQLLTQLDVDGQWGAVATVR